MIAALLLAAAGWAHAVCEMDPALRGRPCDDPKWRAATRAHLECVDAHKGEVVAGNVGCKPARRSAAKAEPAKPAAPPPSPGAEGDQSFGEAAASVEQTQAAQPEEKPRLRPVSLSTLQPKAPGASAKDPEPDLPASQPDPAPEAAPAPQGGRKTLAKPMGKLDGQDWVSRQREMMKRAPKPAKKAEDGDDSDDE